MEPLCKTCCNGACPLQVTKDRLILSCIEYISGMMIGEIADRSDKRLRGEIKTTSEVKPVKHGRWSECYTDSRVYSGICTVCGKASIRSIRENPLEYCPKCGARMDGDTE